MYSVARQPNGTTTKTRLFDLCIIWLWRCELIDGTQRRDLKPRIRRSVISHSDTITLLVATLPPSCMKKMSTSQLYNSRSFTDFCFPQTGRLGLRTGVVTNFDPYSLYGLPLNETTIAEYLNPLYRTAMTGTATQNAFLRPRPNVRNLCLKSEALTPTTRVHRKMALGHSTRLPPALPRL